MLGACPRKSAVQTPQNAFSDLVLDTLRLQERMQAVQNAQGGERAWFLLDTRQTLVRAGLHWMIRHDEACELLEPLPLAFLPHMPPWFCGLAHWHGQLLPVMDLAGFWQLDTQISPPPIKPMLLVLGHGSQAAGVYVDRLPGHVHLHETVPDADFSPIALAPMLQKVLRGSYRQGKKTWLDIDVDALLQNLDDALQAHAKCDLPKH